MSKDKMLRKAFESLDKQSKTRSTRRQLDAIYKFTQAFDRLQQRG